MSSANCTNAPAETPSNAGIAGIGVSLFGVFISLVTAATYAPELDACSKRTRSDPYGGHQLEPQNILGLTDEPF